jgi:hypothetical protein
MSKRVAKPIRRPGTKSGSTIERRLRSAEIQVDRLLRAIRSLRRSVSVVDAPGRRKSRDKPVADSAAHASEPAAELVAALAKVLRGRALAPKEAAARVRRSGYRVSVRGFVDVVKRTLMMSARFRAVGADKFTAKKSRKK